MKYIVKKKICNAYLPCPSGYKQKFELSGGVCKPTLWYYQDL